MKSAEISITKNDVNGDGEEEYIVDGKYIQAVISSPDKLGFEKYGVRFTQGGWVEKIVYKPTGKEYFLQRPKDKPDQVGIYGIPEEFELTIPLEEKEGKKYWVKIGVGEIEGNVKPRAAWTLNKTIKMYPWSYKEINGPGNGKTLQFTQELNDERGIGYALIKQLVFQPDSSAVDISITLKNTGKKAFYTEWYTHCTFAPTGMSKDDWYMIPMLAGNGMDNYAAVLHKAAMAPVNLPVWGFFDAPELGSNPDLYAAGNLAKKDILAVKSDTPYMRFRVWSDPVMFCPEPFIGINLKPTESKSWSFKYLFGNGLANVAAMEKDIAASIDLAPAAKSTDKSVLAIGIISGSKYENLKLTASIKEKDNKTIITTATNGIKNVEPSQPSIFQSELNIKPGIYIVELKIENAGKAPLLLTDTAALQTLWPDPAIKVNGANKNILLVSFDNPKKAKKGEGPLDTIAQCLVTAGFNVKNIFVTDGNENLEKALNRMKEQKINASSVTKAAWDKYDLSAYTAVVICDRGEISKDAGLNLKAFAEKGGGLVFFGPPMKSDPEFTAKVLPITTADSPAEVRYDKYDFPNKSDSIANDRLDIKRAAAAKHPIIDELSYSPARQSVAFYWKVKASETARVLLQYVPTEDPALIIRKAGKGRVAFFTTSARWNVPQIWTIWSGMGIYHQKLLVNTTAWACGLLNE